MVIGLSNYVSRVKNHLQWIFFHTSKPKKYMAVPKGDISVGKIYCKFLSRSNVSAKTTDQKKANLGAPGPSIQCFSFLSSKYQNYSKVSNIRLSSFSQRLRKRMGKKLRKQKKTKRKKEEIIRKGRGKRKDRQSIRKEGVEKSLEIKKDEDL